MRHLILLTALLIHYSLSSFGQQTNSSQCKNLNAIITQMQEWKKSDTTIRFPLKSKRQKPWIGHSFLSSGGYRRSYFSSSATLTGEYASEFGINDEGKCFYTAYMGPYSKDSIDVEGKKLKDKFLSCVNTGLWKISDIANTYLYITYNPIDIPVQIIKTPIKDSDMYRLVISMFRFTPVK